MLGVKPSTSASGSAPEVKMLKLWFKIPNIKEINFFIVLFRSVYSTLVLNQKTNKQRRGQKKESIQFIRIKKGR